MNPFDHLLRDWLAWIVDASWQLALLVSFIAVLTRLMRSASPRLRHALWLLVLVKVFLPPGLSSPVSVGSWGVGPLQNAIGLAPWDANAIWQWAEARTLNGSLEAEAANSALEFTQQAPTSGRVRSSLLLLFCVWGAGCLSFSVFVAGRYMRLVRALRNIPTIDEGPVRIALERIAMDLGLRRCPDIVAADLATVPFLFGVVRPTIVLPRGLLSPWSDVEVRAVLAHELAHWKRGDVWLGWLQTTAQGLFWFHPFLWWANAQLRHCRECACDEIVLGLGRMTPEQYVESIVRMLTSMRGRSLVSGSLVALFERGTKLQDRLEEIMNHQPLKRRFGWPARLLVLATAALLLPMSPGAEERASAVAREDAKASDDDTKKDEPNDSHPRIVKSTPKQGATGVDPALKEISVTFDRDMEQGMSWTGGPPHFPPLDESRNARWTNKRTCILPVKLERGAFYRLGINSTNYQNFRSTEGIEAATAALYFTTKGATEEVESRVRVPKVVSIEPNNGAQDVEVITKSLRVTFDVPMSEGMSWTGGGDEFPKIPEGKKPSWSDDGLTCTLPVLLEPDHDYRLGLNSVTFNNFQSKWGVPLKEVVYKFHTRAAAR